jgi:hypothetical protein
MSKVFYIKETILSFLLTFFFGMRVQGESINLDYGVEQPKHTYIPSDRPADQFVWMSELRVSSLHGVKQNVYLEG